MCGDKHIDIPPVNHGRASEMSNMPTMGHHYGWIICPMGQHNRLVRCPVYGAAPQMVTYPVYKSAPEMSKMPSLWYSTRDGQDALFMEQYQRWVRCPVYGAAPQMVRYPVYMSAPEMRKMPYVWDSTRDGQDVLFMGQEFVGLGVFKTQVIFLEGKQRLSHRKIRTQINDY